MTFHFDYAPGTIRYGEGCIDALADELAAVGADDALVVTGRTVGATAAVMEPVRAGLGDRLAAEFAETTPAKRFETALAGAERFADCGADALVAVGGGSSLDVARIVAALSAAADTPEAAQDTFEDTGVVAVPAAGVPPVVAVPTTLAGADLSMVAGITSRRDGLVRGGAYDEQLMPAALHYDPDLVATTPQDVLSASAMNGFDKAVETAYAATATPITDATAVGALRRLDRGLPALGAGDRDADTMDDVVVGTLLAQYGCSRADGLTLSLVHAFGHGIARGYAVQQGAAHGIIAPHALRYLFDEVDGGRALLADGLDIEASTTDGRADAIVDRVAGIRDALGLPTQLREVDDMAERDLPAVARDVHGDGLMSYCPDGLDPTVEDLEAVLRAAW
ncbi:alcohol dehydrogenase [Halobacteriales archaeon QS_1_69_70]|nr:MAG: alcohol dehydrogenase [Halobacteriales archaeon QS_1_69_70]